jgi:ABC-2 type transport system ATP-binding protein
VTDAAIELSEVSRSYGDVLALDRVSFAVPRGQVCGFLGPNGAGKTTAIRILFDLIRPSTGTAKVLGFDCQTDSARARAAMGYLPGDLRLYDGLSGNELLSMFARLRGETVVPDFGWELCRRLTVDSAQRVANLSKGNKQKLGLILALMHRPQVLVLDEPTSGLDPLVQEEVEQVLRGLADAGHTIFFSSHILSEVERLCDRVVIIRRGKVVAQDDVATLRGRRLHILEVEFSRLPPRELFQIPGVEEVRRERSVVRLQVTSNLDAAIKAIALHPVTDIRTEQPNLEDIFLAYYKEDGAQTEGGTHDKA